LDAKNGHPTPVNRRSSLVIPFLVLSVSTPRPRPMREARLTPPARSNPVKTLPEKYSANPSFHSHDSSQSLALQFKEKSTMKSGGNVSAKRSRRLVDFLTRRPATSPQFSMDSTASPRMCTNVPHRTHFFNANPSAMFRIRVKMGTPPPPYPPGVYRFTKSQVQPAKISPDQRLIQPDSLR
jgi:hypothetical protein